MSNTSDILNVVSKLIESQANKKQREFENSLTLRDIAKRQQRQDALDKINFSNAVLKANEEYNSVLTSLELTKEQFGSNISENIKDLLGNTELSNLERMSKLTDAMTEVQKAATKMINERNSLFSDLLTYSMLDNNPLMSDQELASFKDANTDLTDYEKKWLRDWLDENIKQGATRTNLKEGIARTKVSADIADRLSSGVSKNDAALAGIKQVNASDMSIEDKNIYKELYLTFMDDPAKEEQLQEAATAKIVGEKLGEERNTIYTLYASTAPDFNMYATRSSGMRKLGPMTLSPKFIDAEIQNINESIYDALREAQDWFHGPSEIRALINDIGDEAVPEVRYQKMSDLVDIFSGKGNTKKVHDGDNLVTVARKYGVHPSDANKGLDLLSEYDWVDNSPRKGSTDEGLGRAVYDMVALRDKMVKYRKRYNSLMGAAIQNEKDKADTINKIKEEIKAEMSND